MCFSGICWIWFVLFPACSGLGFPILAFLDFEFGRAYDNLVFELGFGMFGLV